ncbi:MAG: hypothetical protein GTO24_05470, partial [candidate division Zixibacteria bacterium]|nr:hypothetical protein [candidate division Zixibacteria bacterium]
MKLRLLIALLSLTFLVAFTGLSFAQFGSISGRVTDEATGDPIAGAVITLSGIWGFWHTNSQGYYDCDGIPAGAYISTAYAAGYFPQTYPESVIVIEGENTPGIDFALTPAGEGTGSISGTVTDEVTGDPILGAHVIAVGLDNWCFGYAWSDSAGYYIIENLCAGLWAVRAEAFGYVPEIYPDSVSVVEGQNTPGIDFALAPHEGPEFGSISGRVTDEETGIGLPMAHVWAHGHGGTPGGGDTWSDTAGYYLIQSLAAGQYTVGVHKDGYEDEVYPELVTVEEGQNTPDIDFALTFLGGPEFGSISGRITDEETGIGLPMAHVWAHGQGGTPG